MLKKLELGVLALAGVCIVALGLMITVTVVMRNLFGNGIPDNVTIVSELMVGAIFLPLAYVTANYSHITIEFLFNRMGPRLKLWTLAIGSILSLVALSLLALAAWKEFAHAAESGAYFFGELDLPEWPGRLAYLVGAVLFVVRLALICVADVRAAIFGDTGYLVERGAVDHEIIEEG
tara:strand:+ start:7165 stop:7695 length:531 start_codon:yes stop_codon:yes gene_type:complete